jgi:hypothetical protein
MFALLTLFCCIARTTFWGERTSAWDEIESVVASGKEVTIHEAPISAHGFSGSGYIAIDPQTGAGAHLIEGGARGATFASDMGQAISAASLAVSDLLTGPVDKIRILFSHALKYKQLLGSISKAVGAVGLFVQVFGILEEDRLSDNQKLGQVSINVLAAAITSYIVGSLVATGVVAFAGAVGMAMIIGLVLSLSTSLISNTYFAIRRLLERLA